MQATYMEMTDGRESCLRAVDSAAGKQALKVTG